MTMTTKTILMVDSIPEVALDFMNKTHFEEIEMVKALGNIVSEYQQKFKKCFSIFFFLQLF